MRNQLTFFIFLVSVSLSAQNWESTWKDATQKASAENKKIVLVFSGSDWCIPCIKLEKEVWQSEAFIAFSNENLSLYRADFPKRKKNKLSPQLQEANAALAEIYNAKGYFPWVVVLSPSQKQLGTFTYEKNPVSSYLEKINGF
jgi:thioredoxin-related protein